MRLRHNRSTEFEVARAAPRVSTARTWRELSTNPNSALAALHRATALRRAWRPSVDDRISFMRQACADKKVLDIGCVAHESSRIDSPMWLHRHLAEVASLCVGVDVSPDGVAAMTEAGFIAVQHDLCEGLGPIAQHGLFDVIVAGELVEHVESLGMVFQTATDALTREGRLIITTPNPYAPWRVSAGRRGIVWENADHICYLFPSGVAELAERHGLVLTQAFTVDRRRVPWRVAPLRRCYRRLRGRQWLDVGWRSKGSLRPARLEPLLLRLVQTAPLLKRRQFLGETFVYVVSRDTGGECDGDH